MTDPGIVEVDLGDNGGVVRLHSPAEVQEWLTKEVEFWSWLPRQNLQDRTLASYWSKVTKARDSANAIIVRYSKNNDAESYQQLAAVLSEHLHNLYAASTLIHSSTPKAQFIDTIRKTNEKAGAFALWYLIGGTTHESSRDAFLGMMHAYDFEQKRTTNESAYRAAADGVLRDLKASDAEFGRQLDAARKANDDFAQQSAAFLETAKTKFDELVSNFNTSANVSIRDSAEYLRALEKTYNDKLALLAPVAYWTKRRNGHTWGVGLLGAVMVGAFVAGGNFLYRLIQSRDVGWLVFSSQAPGATKDTVGESVTGLYSHHALDVILVAGAAALVVWVLRILVRLFLSQVHLRSAAAERVVMANTYLALLKESAGIQEKDRELILAALFARTPSGLIKDDGIPPGILDLLGRIGRPH